MKFFAKSILSAFILSFIITQTFFNAECEDIPNHLVRLHILANSDSDEDQNLKLKVRDYVLSIAGDIFENANNKVEAEHIATTNVEKIVQQAQQYVYSLGYDYKVQGSMEYQMYFNTRDYQDFSLPAGNYDALRITIGEGKGHNWWCVMFPPMCFSMAENTGDSNTKEDSLDQVLNSQQSEITENKDKYEYRFKIVEIYNEVKNFFMEDK